MPSLQSSESLGTTAGVMRAGWEGAARSNGMEEQDFGTLVSERERLPVT
jgi:hypothetical protein